LKGFQLFKDYLFFDATGQDELYMHTTEAKSTMAMRLTLARASRTMQKNKKQKQPHTHTKAPHTAAL
jgi:hypothetical protein